MEFARVLPPAAESREVYRLDKVPALVFPGSEIAREDPRRLQLRYLPAPIRSSIPQRSLRHRAALSRTLATRPLRYSRSRTSCRLVEATHRRYGSRHPSQGVFYFVDRGVHDLASGRATNSIAAYAETRNQQLS